MPTKNDTWKIITKQLKREIPQSEFNTWFSNTSIKELDTSLVVIEVPNKFVARWLNDHYLIKIRTCFKDYLKYPPEINFCYEGQEKSPAPGSGGKDDRTFSHLVNPNMRFDNFIVSNSNRFAYFSAMEVVKNPATLYNPLYVFSKLSLGKTHLLNAVVNHLAEIDPFKKVKYVSFERYYTDLSIAKKNNALDEFRRGYFDLDFFLIDDIDHISGRDKSQEELINLFNYFYKLNKQIIISGKTSPGQIVNLMPHFRSRLEWGLLTEIEIPDLEMKTEFLRQKMKDEDLYLPEDVIFFLSNSTNELKGISNYIVTLKTYASLYQHEIDISTVKSIIKNKPPNRITIKDIQKATAEYFNISLSDLLSDKKNRKFSYPRQIAVYLSRKLTKLSYKGIGRSFGNKDHSTIIYAVNRIDSSKNNNQSILNDINRIQNFFS